MSDNYELMLWGWVAALVFLLLAVCWCWFSRRNNQRRTIYHYTKKSQIMTDREAELFRVLSAAMAEKYYVAPQVHLDALFDYHVQGQNWQAAFRHLNGKSVDFVLFSKDNMRTRCGIELDDATHGWPERKERDAEVERIFREAGLPLVRLRQIEQMTEQQIVDEIGRQVQAADLVVESERR